MSERPPLIGITTYHRDETGNVRLPAEYGEAVRRAGGIPLLIQPGEPRMAELLEVLDGLILSGGGDIDPARYTGKSHETLYSIDAARDGFELELANRWVQGEKPILCICRGLQVLNVALGGTLITHIPEEVNGPIDHRQPPDKAYGPITHEVRIAEGSRLAEVLGSDRTSGASWHHQAVDTLAPGLEVSARASDGVVEALEMPANPKVIAVQWHPELTAGDDPQQQRLFDEVVRLAKGL